MLRFQTLFETLFTTGWGKCVQNILIMNFSQGILRPSFKERISDANQSQLPNGNEIILVAISRKMINNWWELF